MDEIAAQTAEPSRGTRTLRLHLVSSALLALTVTIWAAQLGDSEGIQGRPFELGFAALLLAFVVVELVTVHIESRGEAHALTFSEIPAVAALVLADPATFLLARVVGGAIVLGIVRRQSLGKLAFNLVLFAFEATVAVSLLRVIPGGSDPVEPSGWPAVFGALLAATVLAAVAVTVAITLFSGYPGRTLVRQVLVFGTVACLANTAIGLAMVASIWDRSYAGLLFLGVGIALYFLYRAFTSLTHRHKNLETLHEFIREVSKSPELDELEASVLQEARTSLRGEKAALLVPPVRDTAAATRLVADRDEIGRVRISPTELAADLTVLLPEGKGRIYEPGQPLPGWLGELGIRDAVIVPVVGDGLPSGAIVVANRLTDVSSFVDDDLQVLATLASHASVALENGRLVAHLQQEAAEKAYEALHDAVTGLPNRQALTNDLTDAIQQAREVEKGVGLVFIDLDTFKEVNDTLGTATADRMLVEVRQRLGSLVPSDMLPHLYRYTGDVFAVLVPEVEGPEPVMALADALHAGFDAPFTSGAISLVLGASLGVALYPEHAASADVLLQRADAASYVARSEGSGIELYAPETDPYAPRRLALAADLREALDAGEVDVFVQPKLSIADEVVRGAEALVRWNHPRLGPIGPDQFIPAAEHTGVIRPLTLYVVRHALEQCRGWREAGYDLGIAVNLSARNLFDSHLADDIAQIVHESGVPPGLLTLELTESTVMSDSQRSLAVLQDLDARGIRLSVDDFGTGYSSLSHLRRLPVDELKIDRSFVSTMTLNEHDAVIVRSLVDLGRNLGLRTVAEGVESQEAWDMLQQYGCDQAQGYLKSRPLPAEQFVAWLQRQQVASLAPAEGVVRFPAKRRTAGTSGH